MTDRELLEAAAKAAGIVGEYESWTGQGFKEGIRQVLNGAKCYRPWNPLTDDGDALRLAVKLGIWVHPDSHTIEAIGHKAVYERIERSVDSESATRRAITRAAAAIAGEG